MVLRRIGGRRVIASTVLARASDIVVIVVFHLENMISLSNLLSKTSDKDMSHRKGLRIGGRWVTASTGAGTSQWGPVARRGNIVRHRKHLPSVWASTCVCEAGCGGRGNICEVATHTRKTCQLSSWTGTWKSWRKHQRTSQTSEAWLISMVEAANAWE